MLLDLLVAGLATWRVSRMLVDEGGPFRVFERLRERSGIEHDANGDPVVYSDGNPLVCLYCTSVWVAPLMLLFPRLARVFAVSALAILVDINGDRE